MTKQHNNQEYKYKFVLYHLNHKEFAQWKITSQKAFDQAVKWVVSVVMRYTNAEGIPYTDFKRLEVDLRANLTVDFTNVRFSFLPITAEESQSLLPFDSMLPFFSEQVGLTEYCV